MRNTLRYEVYKYLPLLPEVNKSKTNNKSNNKTNNKSNNKDYKTNLHEYTSVIPQLEERLNNNYVSELEKALNINTNNNNYVLDSNSVSPYAISYSSFYYDHNKDDYEGIYNNKNWLYEPWVINKKYI